MVEHFKEVSQYIQSNLEGCKFIGISKNNEVFVEFEYDDFEMQNGAALLITRKFPYVSKTTIIIKSSVEEVKKEVENLNNFLENN